MVLASTLMHPSPRQQWSMVFPRKDKSFNHEQLNRLSRSHFGHQLFVTMHGETSKGICRD